MKMKFEELKAEILRRAKEAEACTEQYRRAAKSETLAELMNVVKDNFHWCCEYNVIDTELISSCRDEFAANQIWANESVDTGYLLCGNATVKACGNATVEAYDNATVEAYDNATVKACGNATVEACDNATVEACDNATVEAYGNATVKAYGNATVKAYDNAYCTSYWLIECKLSGNAIYRVQSTNTIFFASDDIKFRKQKSHLADTTETENNIK